MELQNGERKARRGPAGIPDSVLNRAVEMFGAGLTVKEVGNALCIGKSKAYEIRRIAELINKKAPGSEQHEG